jgi:hypothetical protein
VSDVVSVKIHDDISIRGRLHHGKELSRHPSTIWTDKIVRRAPALLNAGQAKREGMAVEVVCARRAKAGFINYENAMLMDLPKLSDFRDLLTHQETGVRFGDFLKRRAKRS